MSCELYGGGGQPGGYCCVMTWHVLPHVLPPVLLLWLHHAAHAA
jgi:hypothetical protein